MFGRAFSIGGRRMLSQAPVKSGFYQQAKPIIAQFGMGVVEGFVEEAFVDGMGLSDDSQVSHMRDQRTAFGGHRDAMKHGFGYGGAGVLGSMIGGGIYKGGKSLLKSGKQDVEVDLSELVSSEVDIPQSSPIPMGKTFTAQEIDEMGLQQRRAYKGLEKFYEEHPHLSSPIDKVKLGLDV